MRQLISSNRVPRVQGLHEPEVRRSSFRPGLRDHQAEPRCDLRRQWRAVADRPAEPTLRRARHVQRLHQLLHHVPHRAEHERWCLSKLVSKIY